MTTSVTIPNTDIHVNPFTGEAVDLEKPESVVEWLVAVKQIEDDILAPLKKSAQEALYTYMDAEARWTIHAGGYEVQGESPDTWQKRSTGTDVDQVWNDLYVLRGRVDHPSDGATVADILAWERDRRAWCDQFFTTKRELTADGRRRLHASGGAYAESVASATKPLDYQPARKRLTPRREEKR